MELVDGLWQLVNQMREIIVSQWKLLHLHTQAGRTQTETNSTTDSQLGEVEETDLFLQYDFIIKALGAIETSQGDPQVVYPLLQENLELLDEAFGSMLHIWIITVLTKANSEQIKVIATLINKFCDLICDFSLDNSVNKLEIAINGYEAVLKVMNPDSYPEIWADAQFGCGKSYRRREQGEEADNLEQAIVAFQQALRVYSIEDTPQKWASTHYRLGVIYYKRTCGERSENLDRAIAFLEGALRAYSSNNISKDWANIQYWLGVVYSERLNGDRVENQEKAIHACEQALVGYDWAYLKDRADTQYWLATIYDARLNGDRVENQEKAIHLCEQALKVYYEDYPKNQADTQYLLATIYYERLQGNKAENQDKALSLLKETLGVYSPEDFPKDWADVQYWFGVVYSERLNGDRVENQEKAIHACEQALVGYDWAYLKDRADTQYWLATIYDARLNGDRVENQEKAIHLCEQALKVYYEDYPKNQADTQYLLATIYYERLQGNKAENQDKALSLLKETLGVYSPEDFPKDWADVQYWFGVVYRELVEGDEDVNQNKAIKAFKEALVSYGKNKYPEDWALVQYNLAISYRDRIAGSREKNLKRAEVACKQALKVYNFERYPEDWADTQNTLGLIYRDSVQIDREVLKEVDRRNLVQAMKACKKALKVRTSEKLPKQRAATTNNIGLIYYLYSERGKKAKYLEKAIKAYQDALQVRTREDLPEQWARTQDNLGLVYRDLHQDDEAIEHFRQALQVYTPQSSPVNCLRVACRLGEVAQQVHYWKTAVEAYELAVQSIEQSCNWAATDRRRRALMEQSIDVYHKLVQSCINLGDPEKALEVVERSKARTLVRLFADRNQIIKGNVSLETTTKVSELRQQILKLQNELLKNEDLLSSDEAIHSAAKLPRISKTWFVSDRQKIQENQKQLRDRQQQLQEKIQKVQDEFNDLLSGIRKLDPSFSLTKRVEVMPFDDIQSLVSDRTAIIEWYITSNRFFAFIVTCNHPSLILISSEQEYTQLLNLADEYLNTYISYKQGNGNNWKFRNFKLVELLNQLAKILQLNKILSYLEEYDRLILVPHLFLHLLPLHAIPLPQQEDKCLLDRFPAGVQYAPSCQLQKLSQQQNSTELKYLFAIQNPTTDLNYADLEVVGINSIFHFPNCHILVGRSATEVALKDAKQQLAQANCLHFCCHGVFDLKSSLKSFFQLAEVEESQESHSIQNYEDGRLTLSEIFVELDLRECRLVTLSACETGLVNPNDVNDEYIGFPSGFLYAGSPSVVSSLWTVNDLSTAFLMIKFYENLRRFDLRQSASIAVALNQAQIWLRNISGRQLKQWLKDQKVPLSQTFKTRSLRAIQDDGQPFREPYYWAAFCAIGQ